MAITVIGTVFVDIKGYPSKDYIPGGRNAGTIETVHGGVARNVAEDLANVCQKTTFITLLDDSGTAADVEAHLTGRGVDMHYCRRTGEGMGTWLAVFNSEGDVVAAISKRPNLLPILDILKESGDEIFQNSEAVLFELDMDQCIVEKIVELSEKYNKPLYALVSNMTIAAERRELLPKTACFVCNLQEAELLFGIRLEGESTKVICAELLRALREERIPCMVVTMGENGAVWASAEGDSGFCPAEHVRIRDTAGAGDAFFAGVAAALTCGKGIQQACVLGTRLAAEAITSSGNVCPPHSPEELALG